MLNLKAKYIYGEHIIQVFRSFLLKEKFHATTGEVGLKITVQRQMPITVE